MSESLRVVSQRESWLQEVRADVVEALEKTLEQAKAGELVGVAIAGVTADHCILTRVSKGNAYPSMLGAVTKMQHELCEIGEGD